MFSPSDIKVNDSVNNEDVLRILNLIKEGDLKISYEGYQNAIIILGNTGSGKTTFAELVTNNNDNLYSEEVNEGSGEFIILDKDDKISVNSTIFSKTTFPELMTDESKTVYIDCPGFNDSRNEAYDIAVSYFITKVLKKVKNVKFALVVSYPSLRKGVSRNDFTQLLKHFTNILKNVEKYSETIAIIATKVDNTYVVDGEKVNLVADEKVVENIAIFLKEVRDNFKQMLENESSMLNVMRDQDNEYIENSLKLIDILLTRNNEQYERIGIVRRPNKKGFLSEIPVLVENKKYNKNLLQQNLEYVSVDNDDIGYTVSDKSTNIIRNLAAELNKEISVQVSQIGANLIEYYKSEEDRLLSVDMYSLIEKLKSGVQILSALKTTDFSSATQLGDAMTTQFENSGTQISSSPFHRIFRLSNILTFLEDVSSQKLDSQKSKWVDELFDAYSYVENSKLWYLLLERFYERLGEYEIQIKFDTNELYQFENEISDENDTKLVENIPSLLEFIDRLKGDDYWLLSIFYQQLKNIRLNKIKLRYLDAIIQSTLVEQITESFTENSSDSQPRSVVVGEFVKLSQLVDERWKFADTSFQIYAKNTVFIDADLEDVMDISIMARRWHIVGNREIRLKKPTVSFEYDQYSFSDDDTYSTIVTEDFGHFFGTGEVFKNIENLTIIDSSDGVANDVQVVQFINLSNNIQTPKVIVKKVTTNDFDVERKEAIKLYPRLKVVSEYRKHITNNFKSFIKKRAALQFYPRLWQDVNLETKDSNEILMDELTEAEKSFQDFDSNVNKILYDSFSTRIGQMEEYTRYSYKRENASEALSRTMLTATLHAAIKCKIIKLKTIPENRFITSRTFLNDIMDLLDHFDENKVDNYYNQTAIKHLEEIKKFLYSNLLVPIEDLISSNNDNTNQLIQSMYLDLPTNPDKNKIISTFLRKNQLKVFEAMSELLRLISFWVKKDFEEIEGVDFRSDNVIPREFVHRDNKTSESPIRMYSKLEELKLKYLQNVEMHKDTVIATLSEQRRLLKAKGFCYNLCKNLQQIEIQLKMAKFNSSSPTMPIEQVSKIYDEIKTILQPYEENTELLEVINRSKLRLWFPESTLNEKGFEKMKYLKMQRISDLFDSLQNEHELFQHLCQKIMQMLEKISTITEWEHRNGFISNNYRTQPQMISNTTSVEVLLDEMKSISANALLDYDLSYITENIYQAAGLLKNVLKMLPSYKDRKLLNAYFRHVNQLKNAPENLKMSIKKDIALYEYEHFLQAYKNYVFPIKVTPTLSPPPSYNNDLDTFFQSLSKNVNYLKSQLNSNSHQNDSTLEADFSGYSTTGPFYTWKHSSHAEAISRLLRGDGISLTSSIPKAPTTEMIKFGNIRLRFESPNDQIQKEFQEILKHFQIEMTHFGDSHYSFCGHIYQLNDPPSIFSYNFNATGFTDVETKNEYKLSPYTNWSFQLKPRDKDLLKSFKLLEPYREQKFSLQLEGRARYISTQNDSVCDHFEKTLPINDSKVINAIVPNEEKLEPHPQRKRRHVNINSIFQFLKNPFQPVLNYLNFDQPSTPNDSKQLPFQYESNTSASRSISTNFNETLTLVDFFVRCFSKTKPVQKAEIIMDLKDVRRSVICILDEFETKLNDLTGRYHLPEHNVQFDPIQLMSQLERELLGGNANATKLIEILLQSVDTSNLSSSQAIRFREDLKQELVDMLLSSTTATTMSSSIPDDKSYAFEDSTLYYTNSTISNQNIGVFDGISQTANNFTKQ